VIRQFFRERPLVAGVLGLAAIGAAALALRWLVPPGDEAVESEPGVAVHVDSIRRATLRRYVTAYGHVVPEPAGSGRTPAGAKLSPVVAGVLTGIDCVEGQHVDRGSVLFQLDSRLAEVAVRKARQDVEFAEKAFNRQEQLLASSGTSQRAYLDAQQRVDDARNALSAAETELAYLRITAPITGTVVRVAAEVGQFVDASTVLAEVVDLDRLVVSARVPADETTGLEVGQPALLGPDSVATGVVRVVGQSIDPLTGTNLVQVSIPPDASFRPGQFTEVRIVAEEHADVMTVPEESLVTRPGEGSWIMAVTGTRAVRQGVAVGLRDRGLVEVSGEGVEDGLPVVTEEAYSLPDEVTIRITGN